jgi:GNAT superfamily N-acetyltransferase
MRKIGHVLGANQAFFYLKRLSQRALVLSAWLDDQPIGAICLSFDKADEPEITRHLPGVPLLYRLHVTEDRRNEGVGTQLLRWAERVAAVCGFTKLAFGVDLHNQRAMNLYSRLGYTEWEFGQIDTMRETYSDDGRLVSLPDRCLIFVKEIG